MQKRFISISLPNLKTDWFIRRQPSLKTIPFVLASPDHGKMMITAVNDLAQIEGVYPGMAVADARAIIPSLEVLNDAPESIVKLLKGISAWFIRYTPIVTTDPPNGILLDATGCAHLWGGEKPYLAHILKRLKDFGYHSQAAIADTIGTAWAVARFGHTSFIIEPGQQTTALFTLPATCLRLEVDTLQRLENLGLRQVKDFISMPPVALRRRFGLQLLKRLNQALGYEEEIMLSIQPECPYLERLPCLEPIVSATGIAIALQRLLDSICTRLLHEEKGLRTAVFKGYRVDGKIETINIATISPSCNRKHLFRLFEDKISTMEPALGIELFTLEAPVTEPCSPLQQKLWANSNGLDDIGLSELLDRLAGKIGENNIYRYVADEHYWPERSFKPAATLHEKIETRWKLNARRPLQLLAKPEAIEVTAPVPDYPPMLFRFKGKLHTVIKADGPERIEAEWWLQEEKHRDYYQVEDEEGNRYWLFRCGHYDVAKSYKWFIHGFFG